MFKSMIVSLSLFLLGTISFGAEGFSPSSLPNILMIKGKTDGATGFALNIENVGRVLISQVHVLQNVKKPMKIQWGYEVTPFYYSEKVNPTGFEFAFVPEILWQDEELDVVVMKLPEELKERCSGLDSKPYVDGRASLIGYPELARRTYPINFRFWIALKVLLGHVQQMVSIGNVWRTPGGEILGDIDALSGDSGGPVISSDGKVIGVIHTMKTWYGEGYKYQSPSINITPIDVVLSHLHATVR